MITIIVLWKMVTIMIVSGNTKFFEKWHIGRVPPGRFEYDMINGFFTPEKAEIIYINDIQCGGFTFKGSKDMINYKAEVCLFHFISDGILPLTEYIKYPNWTTYIGLRDYIVISGQYVTKYQNCTKLLSE
jgi:hypothetical protein